MPVGWKYSRDGPERREHMGLGEREYMTKKQWKERLTAEIRWQGLHTQRIRKAEKAGYSAKRQRELRTEGRRRIKNLKAFLKRWK